jgi:hypothetical protein
MINVKCVVKNTNQPLTIHPLGDRIDLLLFAHLTGLREQEEVTITTPVFKAYEELKELLKFRNVSLNVKGPFSREISYEGFQPWRLFRDLYSKIDQYPQIDIPEVYVELPESFIVVQWDAQQRYRQIDPDRIKTIEKYYDKPIVVIGGQADSFKLKHDLFAISYVISKADLFVGADSGFIHLAKLIKPTEYIHIYNNPTPMSGSSRTWSSQCVELVRKGAKLNYCENYELPDIYKNWETFEP